MLLRTLPQSSNGSGGHGFVDAMVKASDLAALGWLIAIARYCRLSSCSVLDHQLTYQQGTYKKKVNNTFRKGKQLHFGE
jgi:hypothetical protein